MAATRHLSKLNPNHPVHIQCKERSTFNTMPIEKGQTEPEAHCAANDKSSDKMYRQPLRETILGTTILVVAGAYVLLKLHRSLQEDNMHKTLSALQRYNTRTLMAGLMITEGLMISCVVLGFAFGIRRAFWKTKGRYQTAKEWGREALVVLIPFYLGAIVAGFTMARIGLGFVMARDMGHSY